MDTPNRSSSGSLPKMHKSGMEQKEKRNRTHRDTVTAIVMQTKPWCVAKNGCWIWTRSIFKNGYGQATGSLAHRIVYEAIKGPIPPGKCIDHLCRIRACVNPDHMESVTHAINNRRGNATKLTAEKVVLIREAVAANAKRIPTIAHEFGINRSCVTIIAQGRTWKDIGGPRVPQLQPKKHIFLGLTQEKINLILEMRKSGRSYMQISRATGVSKTHVWRITKQVHV